LETWEILNFPGSQARCIRKEYVKMRCTVSISDMRCLYTEAAVIITTARSTVLSFRALYPQSPLSSHIKKSFHINRYLELYLNNIEPVTQKSYVTTEERRWSRYYYFGLMGSCEPGFVTFMFVLFLFYTVDYIL
jgi:hypothetical protein